MGCFAALYLNSADRLLSDFAQAVIADLRRVPWREALGTLVYYRDGYPWLVVEGGHQYGLKLTKEYATEAVSLQTVSSVFACDYTHFVDGVVRRDLSFCSEGKGWERVKGEPEPWESELLFDNQEEDLANLKKQLARATETKEKSRYKKEIEAISNRTIIAFSPYPCFNADFIAKAFGLPGFGPEIRDFNLMKTWWTFKDAV